MTDTSAVLFADIEGTTGLRTRLGDRSAEVIMESQAELLRDATSHHGGRPLANQQGFAAAFVTCRAAVDCAVAIRRGYQIFAEEGLRLRIGIDCGQEDPGVARGIARTGATGQVLVGAPVVERAGVMPGVQFVDRGERILEGEAAARPVLEVQFSIRRERSRSPVLGPSTAFEGREEERAALRETLDRALAGHGSVVLIAGESGAGKSDLAESAAREAFDGGFLALEGHCEQLEDPPAFMPLLEIMRSAASVVPREVLRDTLGENAGAIARMLPELREAFMDIPEVAAGTPDQERDMMIEACLGFLERTSARRPLALVLDALQWADASSVRLLREAADRLADMPAVIIGTYRESEGADGPFANALPGLLAHPVVSRIVLGPAAT
jgi:hypothetical protein